MRNAGLEEAQAGIEIAGRNINNLRYADAISFSNAWKWKVKVKSFSCVQLLATPWTAAYQAPPSMDFSGKSTGVGCHSLLTANAEINELNLCSKEKC